MPKYQGVIVDKSFLQACPPELFAETVKKYQLLMPDSPFYEMLSNEGFRARCFRKPPDGIRMPGFPACPLNGQASRPLKFRSI